MPKMTSAEHFNAAEKLLAEAETNHEPDTRAEWCLELAKMHLGLSLAGRKPRVLPPHPLGQEAQQQVTLPPEPEPDPVRTGRSGPSVGPPAPGTLGTDDKPARPERR
jgi:hypothetical protein